MTIRIREAVRKDVPFIAVLIEEIERHYGAVQVQPFAERVEQVRAALFGQQPVARVLLAEHDGQVVGLASYSFHWPAAGSTTALYLKELYVVPDFRRRGIGSQLMANVQHIAELPPSCSWVEWTTERDNAGARAFYQHLRYTEFHGSVIYRALPRTPKSVEQYPPNWICRCPTCSAARET
jgi:GNAT superfamily N-acetyltransferase